MDRLEASEGLENTTRDRLRREMPVTERYAYFDHAAVAPLPQASADAIRTWVDQSLLHGDIHWPKWSAAANRLRASSAAMLHCQPKEIALVPNTTFGINVVAHGFRWNPGDNENVVVLENEFSSNLLPWQQLVRRGIQVRQVPVPPNGIVDLESIRARIDGKTRIVSVSWVGYASGFRIDLEALCDMVHRAGALLFVDAIQGLGVFPLNTSTIPIDFAAADGHKWLLGPEGAGLLYIRQSNLDRLEPMMTGWGSIEASHLFQTHGMQLKNDASRYEGGSANFAGQIGLGESMQLLIGLGCHQIHSPVAEAVLENAALIEEKLKSIGAIVMGARSQPLPMHNLSGILSFQLPHRDPMEVRQKLLQESVVLSVRHGCLRVATHAYNSREDIARLIDALA
jgi:selenocysteine lyase/cysteine desulfurase